MDFNVLIFTKTDCYIEGTAQKQFIRPSGIMWHSTGANNPKLSRFVGPDDGRLGKNPYGNHWNQKRSRRVCPHAWVGKLKNGNVATYQCLPWDLRGWHSGASIKGNANSFGYIGFEICEDGLNNKEYAMKVYQESIELTAYLCKKYNIDPLGKNTYGFPTIIDHAEGHKLKIASNHGDVMHWYKRYGIDIKKIRQDVAVEMGKSLPVETPPTSPIGPGKIPYTIRLTKGTPYYRTTSTQYIAGIIAATTNYTIVEEQGNYGRLKSGAGWVQLVPDPKPSIPPAVDFKPYTIYLVKGIIYYGNPDGKVERGKIVVPTNYTIIEEKNGYGKLKSGVGWIKLSDGSISAPPTTSPSTPKEDIPAIVKNWAITHKVSLNSRGKVVEAAQVALVLRGYDIGGIIDGHCGPKTVAAIKKLQKKFGFAVDGIIGIDTWPVLLGLTSRTVATIPTIVKNWAITNKIAQGNRTVLVTVAQASLALRGYDIGGVIDNLFGPVTKTAVLALQKKNEYVQDGIIGVDSWPALLG